jgi:hypothetical protein
VFSQPPPPHLSLLLCRVLSQNRLSGTIPPIENLLSLQFIALNRNQFTGSVPAIPASVFQPHQVAAIVLHDNFLSCLLPPIPPGGVLNSSVDFTALVAPGNAFCGDLIPNWVSAVEKEASALFSSTAPETSLVLSIVSSAALFFLCLGILAITIRGQPMKFGTPYPASVYPPLAFFHHTLSTLIVLSIYSSLLLLPFYISGANLYQCGRKMSGITIAYLAHAPTLEFVVMISSLVFTVLCILMLVRLRRLAGPAYDYLISQIDPLAMSLAAPLMK